MNHDLEFAKAVKQLSNCNTCGNKECEHRPKIGEIVRFNCFAWKQKEFEIKQVGNNDFEFKNVSEE